MDEVTIRVDAPPHRVWELVSDPTRYGDWSPENTGARWIGGATGPAPDARFRGTNRHGLVRWVTTCTITECEEPRAFAFRVRENRMRWGYRIEADGAGSRVTEWRDRDGDPPLIARLFVLTGIAGRDREQLMVDGMRQTLAALKAAAERELAS